MQTKYFFQTNCLDTIVYRTLICRYQVLTFLQSLKGWVGKSAQRGYLEFLPEFGSDAGNLRREIGISRGMLA